MKTGHPALVTIGPSYSNVNKKDIGTYVIDISIRMNVTFKCSWIVAEIMQCCVAYLIAPPVPSTVQLFSSFTESTPRLYVHYLFHISWTLLLYSCQPSKTAHIVKAKRLIFCLSL